MSTILENNEVSIIIFILLMIVYLIILYRVLYPRLKKKKIQRSIKKKIRYDKYLLYYQPIVNPKTNSITAFEALLRLKDDKLGIVGPHTFINEIEANDMFFDISIWALKRIIKDYDLIKQNEYILNDDIYISMNISAKEIENEQFIVQCIEILSDSKIGKNKICLEIIERIAISNVIKIQSDIKLLKEAGFLIAIDDFGVDYSNLDILEKIDFDILKLDKYFIDYIESSNTSKSILKFLSVFSLDTNKSIILEGVENVEQKNIIKEIGNGEFYIQGYIYSRPVPIEELDKINLGNFKKND